MSDLRDGPSQLDVTVAALFAFPFAGYLVVMQIVSPPTGAE